MQRKQAYVYIYKQLHSNKRGSAYGSRAINAERGVGVGPFQVQLLMLQYPFQLEHLFQLIQSKNKLIGTSSLTS